MIWRWCLVATGISGTSYLPKEPTVTSILIDDDLLLRSLKPDDAAELFHCVDHNRAHIRTWLNWVDSTTRVEHSLQFIQMSIGWQAQEQGMALGIFALPERKLIGCIGMHNWNAEQKRAQIGYWIGSDYEGKGLMFRSAVRFVDFLFQRLGLNKVEIHIVPSNTRSLELAKRLGARIEGRIRQCHLSNGKLEDIIITGILREEWMSLHAIKH